MISLLFIIDPVTQLDPAKDSSLALIEAAHHLGWQVMIAEGNDLFIADNQLHTKAQVVHSIDCQRQSDWITLGPEEPLKTVCFHRIFMRLEPPVNPYFWHTCQLLRLAKPQQVINNPTAIMQWNEKLVTTEFPDASPPTVVSAHIQPLLDFYHHHQSIVIKPLDGFGGQGITFLQPHQSSQASDIIQSCIDQYGLLLSQPYLPAIALGDKRVFLIDGQPYHWALNRVPKPGGLGNLMQQATAEVVAVTERDRYLADLIGPKIFAAGIRFAGLDIIGDWVSEINITCPTGLRHVHQIQQDDLATFCLKQWCL